jgi:hypothetical protein
MAKLEYISLEEARARLLVAYGRAGDRELLETLPDAYLSTTRLPFFAFPHYTLGVPPNSAKV